MCVVSLQVVAQFFGSEEAGCEKAQESAGQKILDGVRCARQGGEGTGISPPDLKAGKLDETNVEELMVRLVEDGLLYYKGPNKDKVDHRCAAFKRGWAGAGGKHTERLTTSDSDNNISFIETLSHKKEVRGSSFF
jgi:hypothetical protein